LRVDVTWESAAREDSGRFQETFEVDVSWAGYRKQLWGLAKMDAGSGLIALIIRIKY